MKSLKSGVITASLFDNDLKNNIQRPFSDNMTDQPIKDIWDFFSAQSWCGWICAIRNMPYILLQNLIVGTSAMLLMYFWVLFSQLFDWTFTLKILLDRTVIFTASSEFFPSLLPPMNLAHHYYPDYPDLRPMGDSDRNDGLSLSSTITAVYSFNTIW